MKALLIGINSFLGMHLSKWLVASGDEVYGTVNEGQYNGVAVKRVYRADTTSMPDLERVVARVCPDVIYHIAGVSSTACSWMKPSLTFDINVAGTINLLNCVARHCKSATVLLVGTSEQYGIVERENCPIAEDFPQRPNSPYAISKHTQEQLGALYKQAYDIKIVMTRTFNLIGAYQQIGYEALDICKQISNAEKGLAQGVIRVGDASIIRDYIDVRDAVKLYRLLALNGRCGEVYNVGSGKGHSVKEIADMVFPFASCKVALHEDQSKRKADTIPVSYADMSKAKNEFNWSPQIPIKQSLEDTLNFFRHR